ncbi:MAG: TetR family transcriptional regulator [Actinobacteria bacterium]|nr:TetR family transcriptional regulator [Actinomycetota bacterium]
MAGRGEQPDQTRSARPRGRRPVREDTRAVLITAAGEVFTERGYDGATVRAIADRAGMDPAMVNHWFGGKDGLFLAALQIPLDPGQILPRLLDGDPEQLGARVVRTFLTVWDASGGGAMAALIRSVASHPEAAAMMREFVSRVILGRVVGSVAPDRPELRAALTGTQLIGLGMVRYVLRLEPLASADHDTVVAAVAPNLQRYLTGRLDV